MIKVAGCIDNLIRRVGELFAWTLVALVLAIILQVVLRYCWHLSFVWLEELQWHLYAAGFMIGLAYAAVDDAHIRVDIVHQRLGKRSQALVDLAGTLLLMLPFVVALGWYSMDFVAGAIRVHERSDATAGLPWRWVIKAFIPASCFLLALAGVSRLLRCIAALRSSHDT